MSKLFLIKDVFSKPPGFKDQAIADWSVNAELRNYRYPAITAPARCRREREFRLPSDPPLSMVATLGFAITPAVLPIMNIYVEWPA